MKSSVLRTGLIGQNISRTRLPAALEMMCRDAGLELEFEAIDSQDGDRFDLARCVAERRSEGWSGVSVTHPFKPEAAALFQGPARKLGASNLLLFTGPPTALNTDYTGFLSAWKSMLGDRTPGNVVMAGAGGVARAIATALVELGATDIAIWDKVPGKAEILADEIGSPARAVPISAAEQEIGHAEGVVNATNLGMAGYGGSAFPDILPGAPKWAFDAVYTPVVTPFLASATAAGASAICGFELFKHMAIQQFKALSGCTPATDTLDKLDELMPTGEAA